MRRSNPLPAALAGFVITCFMLSPAPASAGASAVAAAPVASVSPAAR